MASEARMKFDSLILAGILGLAAGIAIAAWWEQPALAPAPVVVVHPHPEMPAKKIGDEEQKTFFEPAGLYTNADITANGDSVPAVKFKGIKATHDDNPKRGEKICPISKTKANPKFIWVVGGQKYEFCCVPCIEEFVDLAKTKPGDVRSPADYIQR
jgi:hypothetical protein